MRASPIVAFLCLALAPLIGSGPQLDHQVAHEIEAVLGDALRFDAGHEAPISEEHVEAAQRLSEDGCYACASRQSSSTYVWLAGWRGRLPSPTGAAAAEVRLPFQRHEFEPALGRAPPA